MRTVHLLRHAKAEPGGPGVTDAERPLAPRGRQEAERLRHHLRHEQIHPALVLCSPSKRTRQTVEIVLHGMRPRPPVELVPALYLAHSEEMIDILREVDGGVESVMLVGHNPGLQALGLQLADHGAALQRLRQKFPTGSLATVALPVDAWAALPATGELTALVVGHELP